MNKLFITIGYRLGGPFDIETNMKEEYVPDVIEAYLQDVAGKGRDTNETNDFTAYEITLTIDLKDDTITVTHNCGNLSLVSGILFDVLRRLHDNDN